MKLQEIITNPARDEFIDKYEHEFADSQPVATVRNLVLKIAKRDDFTYLGLFNNDLLVGILKTMQYKDTNMQQVCLVQVAQAYKGNGYGNFLYDYVVMDMNTPLLSDVNLSVDVQGGSMGLWKRLYRQGRYAVRAFDTRTDTIIDATPFQLEQQQDAHTLFIAIPPGKTINETINIQQQQSPDRTIVWYGPTIVSGDYL